MTTITISLPDTVYKRLQRMAQATKQSLPDVVVRAVEIGSPPSWQDAPTEHHATLAELENLSDDALWNIARTQIGENEMARYELLLDKNSEGALSPLETEELSLLKTAANRFMLRKAHAAALLKWRGHIIPPAHKL